MPKKEFIITPQDENQRLDLFLSQRIKELSRSQIQKLIIEKEVLVNGQSKKPSYRLRVGERVNLEYKDRPSHEIQAEKIPLNIIYCDEHIIVVDKPSGMVVHPGAGVRGGTLVNALLHYFPEIAEVGPAERPGIVHRLDKDTSGIMIVARSLNAYQSLQQQFKKREVEKHYIGLVLGKMSQKSGEITWSIGRHPRRGGRISVKTKRPRLAITHYEVEKEWKEFSLLRIKPLTGRTHQIRVHLAAAGHPLAGDRRYGHWKCRSKSSRLFLHSSYLAFFHPETGKRIEFSSPLPLDLKGFLKEMIHGLEED